MNKIEDIVMKIDYYKCKTCDNVCSHSVSNNEKFPGSIICKCGSPAKRMISAPYSIIHQGKAGNAKNGYTSNSVSIKKT